MKESNPFYKERALSPLQDKAKTLKLSSEVFTEYENHFRDKYPKLIKKNGKLNDNQIITKLLIDYLNTQCLERKYFNFDVLVTVPKVSIDSASKEFSLIGIRNDYKIVKNNLQNNYATLNRADNGFFESEEIIPIHKVYNYFNMNYFTFSLMDLVTNDFKSFVDCFSSDLSDKFDSDIDFFDSEVNHILFRVNNFLDTFEDGVFKGEFSNSNIHKGIGEASLEDGSKTYFVYYWSYDSEEFNLLDFKLVTKEEFISLVFNSSNEELKDFVKSHEEVKAEDIPSSEEVTVNNLKDRVIELEEMVLSLEKDKQLKDNEIYYLNEKIKVYEEDKSKLEELESDMNRINHFIKLSLESDFPFDKLK